MQKKKSISNPKKGMNRDVINSSQQNIEYQLGVNINTESETGEQLNVQLEPSNRFGVNFPNGYKILGFKTDILKERTYYFLVNTEETDNLNENFKRSSIGYVDNSLVLNNDFNNTLNLEDCGDCTEVNNLNTPLEEQVQIPSQTYVELVHDRCIDLADLEEKGLNFNINFPIKKIEIKQEKLGTNLYWNDWRNNFRYLQVTRQEEDNYLYIQEVPCDDDIILDCLDVDKLLVSPKHTKMVIEANEEQIGGNLKMGTYEFWGAYCDAFGNETTEYCTPTNPITIWDENNYIQSQTETDEFTNYAIKLKIHNLDVERFKYYKIAVVERNNVANTQSVFLVGIYPTTDDTVVYTHSGSSNDDLYITRGNISLKKRMDFSDLALVKPMFKRMKGTMVSDDRLFAFGLEEEEEINLQPVVNIFTPLVKWATSASTENLYKSPVANSKYKGYPRNEVQALAIRFLTKNGGYTANFPFVGRPKTTEDDEIIDEDDKNKISLDESSTACSVNTRDRKWQIYNTASVLEDQECDEAYSNNAIETTSEIEKYCLVDIETEIPTNTLSIELEDPFFGLEDYINTHSDDICDTGSQYYDAFLCGYLSDTYAETCEPPFNGDCSDPELVSEDILIKEVVGEQQEKIQKEIEEYQKSIPPKYCYPYKRNTESGAFENDTTFMQDFIPCGEKVFKRDGDFFNEDCGYATDVPLQINPLQFLGMNFLNYGGGHTIDEVLNQNNSFLTSTTATGFYSNIHNNAQFFKVEKNNKTEILLEFTKKSNCLGNGDFFDSVNNTEVRYTIYDNCTDKNELDSGIVDLSTGELIYLDISTFPNKFIIAVDTKITEYIIKENCDSLYPNITSTTYTQPTLPIAVGSPSAGETVLIQDSGDIYTFNGTDWILSHVKSFLVSPPCGCFGLYIRDIEYKSITVTWTSIKLEKKITYQSTCTFFIPKVNDCDPVPYKKGIMAYWESTVEYPDNKELYDSSTIEIKPTDLINLSDTDKTLFEQYFTDGTNISGNYVWKEVGGKSIVDLTCSPIRHNKMPDNKIAPYIVDSITYPNNSDSIIFPLGISLDNEIVNTMLQVAYNNGLITKKQKESIVGWEILRGDNSIHKSVIANGIAFDMYNYTKNGQKIHFQNFPFNDLGENKFCLDPSTGGLIQHPYSGLSNNLFTFLSPDLFLTKPVIPSEMSVQGYLFGEANIGFADVKDHPEWTILGDKAYNLADKLAQAEVALEIIIATSQGLSQGWVTFGTSSGLNFGWIAAIISLVGLSVQSFVKLGKYRYEWLRTFRDLGRTDNFASFQYGAGKLNRFVTDSDDSNYLRRLSLKKYLKEGRYTVVDENDGKSIKINNELREHAILLATGSQHISYTNADYNTYDNNKRGSKTSNFIASEESCQNETDYARNIANPYVTLKNYIPDQWDTIDSIKWLTTNYIFDLQNNTVCKPIFGGTVVISRFSWRKKVPFFRVNNIKGADKTPFLYSKHSNIGNTRFFCNYETAEDMEFSFLGVFFPDIKSDYQFDCLSGNNKFYLRPPSKFYLFSHGIVDFLVESEINCNFRYAKKEPENQFYINQSLQEWLQEVNLSISEPNTFFYNNSFSFPVSNSKYKVLDRTYNKDIWKKRAMRNNAWIWSEKDNSEDALVDPWLIFKPLNFWEDKSSRGLLIDLKNIESDQFLGRYENQLQLFNQTNPVADAINNQTKTTGTGFLYNRPINFKTADLGFAGTQNTDIVSTPYGHFWCDAKRGKIFKIDQNGQNLEIISEVIQGQSSGMKNWFREHLPFKILKYFPDIDIDNKFKGLGLNMWWDDRFNRLFITKRDYIIKNSECLKYGEEGFYTDCENEVITCPEGYTYNEETELCELVTNSAEICPEGYTFDQEQNLCVLVEESEANCEETFSLFPINANNASFSITFFTPQTFTVDWGDGTINSLTSHNYSTPFTGEIKIYTVLNEVKVLNQVGGTSTNIEVKTSELMKLVQLETLNLSVNSPKSLLTGVISELPNTLISVIVRETTIAGILSDLPNNIEDFQIASSINNPNISGNIDDIPPTIVSFELNCANTISGDLLGISTCLNLELFRVFGLNTISGDINNFPVSSKDILVRGNNTINGTISGLTTKINLVRFEISGVNTISGNITDLPNSIITVIIEGFNTITGDIKNIPINIKTFIIKGTSSFTYTSGRIWSNNMVEIWVRGSLTSTEVNNLLIDLANVVTWQAPSAVRIIGVNAPRTSTSNSAVATLMTKGVTVITN